MKKKLLIILLLLLVLICFVLISIYSLKEKEINVKDFLSNDFNDQVGIQKAIDYAEKKQILIVRFPEGKYVVNSPIRVGNNITLKLNENAVIYRNFSGKGSDNATIRNKKQKSNGNHDITIDGGIIKASNEKATGKHLAFWGVENLKINNLKIRETYSDWATIFRGINNVEITKLDIDTISDGLYTDGLHFVGGSNISIDNCKVISGDDSIAFTIENKHDGKISNVKVSNSDLTSKRASILKFLVTDDTKHSIDGVTVTNIQGIGGTIYSGQAIVLKDRSNKKRISNIVLKDINIDASRGAGYGLLASSIKDLRVDNLSIHKSEGTSMYLFNSENIDILNSKISSPRNINSNGITMEGIKRAKIIKTLIDSPGKFGIVLNESKYPSTGIVIEDTKVINSKLPKMAVLKDDYHKTVDVNSTGFSN